MSKASETKLSFNEQKELNNIESKLKSLEFDKKELESQFLEEGISMDAINSLSEALKALQNLIEEKEMRWFELNEKLNWIHCFHTYAFGGALKMNMQSTPPLFLS